MIRFFSFILFALISACVYSKSPTVVGLQIDGICYDFLSQNEVEVSSPFNNFYKDSLVIPETVVYNDKEYAVVRIQEQACYKCANLTYVKLPTSLREIGMLAFAYCSSLTEVVFPESLQKIGYYAFVECGLKNITIPEGLTEIENEAFSGNSSLKTVKLPNSITEIRREAFDGCSSLKQINIPTGLKSIRYRTFHDCGLTKIDIPENIDSIEDHAFDWCRSLLEVKLPKSLKYLGCAAFNYCGIARIDLSITQIKTIRVSCFHGCQSLDEVIFPEQLDSIEREAFCGCNLSELNFPQTLTFVGEDAFDGTPWCSKQPSTVYINNIFYLCKVNPDTRNVIIKEGTRYISPCAFLGNYYLRSVTIPEGVEEIPEACFNGCTNLENMFFPSSLKRMIGGGNGKWESSLPEGPNYVHNVFYEYKGKTPEEYSIEEGTISIATYAFSSKNDLKKITIPETVEYIEDYTFYNCKYLNDVVIPSSVKYIGPSAFSGTTSLENVSFDCPGTVASVDGFLWADNFHEVTNVTLLEHVSDFRTFNFKELDLNVLNSKASQPPLLDESQFSEEQFLEVNVSVPMSALPLYKADNVWGKFFNLKGEEDVSSINDSRFISNLDSNRMFTVSGNVVNNNSSLSPGVYITNGKKKIVR